MEDVDDILFLVCVLYLGACLCVCVSVCVRACVSVKITITFELLGLEL